MMTKHTKQTIGALAGTAIVLGFVWVRIAVGVVVTSAEQDPGCVRKPCYSVDVRKEAFRFERLAKMGGCFYNANLYMNGKRLSSNRFMFDSGCPESISLQWTSPNHCTIDFGGTKAHVEFSGNTTEWKYGTP